MKKLFNKTLIAAALALPALAYSAATPILFDTNGAGAGGVVSVDLLDWAPGNALAVGGNPVTGFLAPGTTTQLLYQANLGLASLSGVTKFVANFDPGTGVTSLGFTAVAGFRESVISNSTGLNPTFGFADAPVRSATNFFYIYANAVGNNLAGTGFVGTPGQIALSGYISSVNSSNFTGTGLTIINPNTGLPIPAPLDNFGANNYSGITTLVGSGTSDLNIAIDFVNTTYFPNLVAGSSFSFFNNSQVDPFSQVDPSGFFSSNGTTGANTALNVGAVNGVHQSGDPTRNFVFQADGNSSFQVRAVPEPGSLALLGLALGIAGVVRRRTAKQV